MTGRWKERVGCASLVAARFKKKRKEKKRPKKERKKERRKEKLGNKKMKNPVHIDATGDDTVALGDDFKKKTIEGRNSVEFSKTR